MVRGPDPAGKSPDVNFVSMLRLGYEFELSRKMHTGFFFNFFISIQINFRFLCVVYVCSNHLDVFTPMPEVL